MRLTDGTDVSIERLDDASMRFLERVGNKLMGLKLSSVDHECIDRLSSVEMPMLNKLECRFSMEDIDERAIEKLWHKMPALEELKLHVELVQHADHVSVIDFSVIKKTLRALSVSYMHRDESYVGTVVLPDSMWDLPELRTLRIECPEYYEVPDSVSRLYNLTSLDLPMCFSLPKLPDSLVNLANLTVVDIRDSDHWSGLVVPPAIVNLVVR
jgi:hypothetical protein